MTELTAAHAGLEKSPAVPGALVHRRDFHGLVFLQIFQRERKLMLHQSLHLQPVRGGIDAQGNAREVIADKEGIVWRDDTLVENGERRLQLWRPGGQQDHRALLRILCQHALTVLKRELHRFALRIRRDGRRGHGAELQKLPPGLTIHAGDSSGNPAKSKARATRMHAKGNLAGGIGHEWIWLVPGHFPHEDGES